MKSVFKKLRNIAEKSFFSEEGLKGLERMSLIQVAVFGGGALLIFLLMYIAEPFVFPLPAPVIPFTIFSAIAFMLWGIFRLLRLIIKKRKRR